MESSSIEDICGQQRPVTNGGENCNDRFANRPEILSVRNINVNPLNDLNPLDEDVELADLNAKLEETTEMLEEEDEEEHEEVIEEHILEEVEEEEDIMGETEILEDEEVDDAEAVVPDNSEVDGALNNNKTPTQVPKKRKNNEIEGTLRKRERNDSQTENSQDNVDCEQPTSSSRTKQTQEEEVDENQCRVCTTKDDLVSLFKMIEQSTVAEMLMSICPSVSIAIKDFLPQYICNPCLDNVVIAVLLKNQCESTEKELRKKLSRHKNKIRRPTGYVTIDGPLDPDSDPASDEELNNDDEFKVSDVASATPDEDSYDTDSSEEKKTKVRSLNPRRGRPKTIVTTPTFFSKNSIEQEKKPNFQRKRSSENESTDDEDNKYKRKRTSVSDDSQSEQFQCDECEQVFTRKLSLVLHKKTHCEPIACEVCGKQFKMRGAYRTHLEKHKEGNMGHKCYKCKRVVSSTAELRRHLIEEHHDREVMRECHKCKRTFSSLARLHRHQQGRCPGSETRRKQDIEAFAMGKDLFKSVAPLTTTYWSDSFSD
uniref:Protein krueppel n=1 Tax=Glossina brevipalpis TaxID=37001 RepID=A0A1A9W2D2_9MUSC